ncbi:hypothetical protein Glove_1033g24 [Diversispora epigaea]|uniref:Uncharacterized protein n=1 Tax=Diversispora epigaea TaxID=1348612 RepID=A0A397G3V3_9GLOM|nr:hypothetical protein Glove_1033g24 [Diversispora epigaea]
MNSTDVISSLESIETFDSFDNVVANIQIQNHHDTVQSQVIDRLISFAEYCDMNKWIMFKANITDSEILEIMCSYSAKVSNVKSMLNMICNKNDGTESGIELSIIEKFSKNGYSFFTWIKMEHGNYAPRLFSFFNDFGDEIKAYFENNVLCFQCKKVKRFLKLS